MTLEHRLDRLSPGLSARERAVLSIRANLEDRHEDPAIRGTMPRDQIAEFNHLIAVGNGVLHIMFPHALVLSGDVEALQLRYAMLLLLRVVSKDAQRESVKALTVQVRRELSACWARLLALEEVGTEVELEFGDPAAIPEPWRDLVVGARRDLEALHAEVQPHIGSVQLPGAEESMIAQLRQGIRNQDS